MIETEETKQWIQTARGFFAHHISNELVRQGLGFTEIVERYGVHKNVAGDLRRGYLLENSISWYLTVALRIGLKVDITCIHL